MRLLMIPVLLAVFITSCSAQKAKTEDVGVKKDLGRKSVVLVELFTSEGCSSCPPADRALAYLAKQPLNGVEIVTMALHVDYWDDYGWHDRFSAHVFTERQQTYARKMKVDSTYTPQMIVDGGTEFVGNNTGKATTVINEAAKSVKGNVEISPEADKLKIAISKLPEHEKAVVYLAITEDGLFTDVKGGENGGSRLDHTSVVRQLKEVGKIEAGVDGAELIAELKLDAKWNNKNTNYVVFAQEMESKRVIAIGKEPK